MRRKRDQRDQADLVVKEEEQMEHETDLQVNEYQNPIQYESRFKFDAEKKNMIQSREKELNPEADVMKAYVEHVRDVDANIDMLKERTKKYDTLGQYLEEKTRLSKDASSWLGERKFPSEKDLNKKMDDASLLIFGTESISKSQRTKRGKKFKEKAG